MLCSGGQLLKKQSVSASEKRMYAVRKAIMTWPLLFMKNYASLLNLPG